VFDAVTSGAVSMDMRLLVSKFAGKDEKIRVQRVQFIPGGSAANIAVGLARLGKSVGCLGKVGNDDFGKKLVSGLEAENVTSFISVVEERTGTAIVVLTPDGENAIYVLPGANELLSLEDVKPECMDTRIFIQTGVSGLSFETAKKNLRRAKKLGVVTCFSPSLYMLKRPDVKDMLANTDILIFNRKEASTISGTNNIKASFDIVSKQGPRIIIVMLGSEGATGWFNGKIFNSPAFEVKAVDTVGAGDAFVAGFISAYLDGADYVTMLKYGCAVAALKVMREGARPLYKREDVDRFLRENR